MAADKCEGGSGPFGSRSNYAVMKLISNVIEGLSSARSRQVGKDVDWLTDPEFFPLVLAAISGVLERLRPPGAEMPSLDQINGGRLLSAVAVERVQKADPTLPLGTAQADEERRVLGLMKNDLGSVIENADTEITFIKNEDDNEG